MAARHNWIDYPFSPRRSPFPYHWVILAVGTTGFMMSAPGQTIGVSAFTDKLIEVLSISRMQLSLAYMLGTIGSSFLLPFAGAAYDRWGARVLAIVSGLFLGGVLVALSRCDQIAEGFSSLLGVPGSTAVTFVVITALLLALRFSGQGVMTMVSRNMVMKWFRKRRGLTSAVMGVFVGLTFSIAPRIYDGLIQFRTWRWAWVVIGLVTAVGFGAVALVFFRDNPEQCGLVPDIKPPEDGEEGVYEPERDFTLSEALRTPAFWIFNLGLAIFSFHITAFTFHVVSIFEEAGVGRTAALSIFPKVAVISVTGSIVVGYLADRIRLKYVLFALATGVAASSAGVSMLAARPLQATVMIIIGNGLASAPFGILSSMTWPRFYGRTHLGKISGAYLGVAVFASAVGPSAYAWGKTMIGTYSLVAFGVMVTSMAALVAAVWAVNPSLSKAGPAARTDG